ncbi:MAG TPA: FAD-dependent monooxygenase [Ktedonobacterales bacterium]|jgi:2-polyprenyl-6-methoxyphenol hydroxylase-like FAD-dependent oxidoreductase
MAHVERILIAGGGIAGLSLATALRQQGFAPETVEIVERSQTWPAVGAGIALHANGGRVLRSLGLGDAIDRAATPFSRWGFYDQHAEQLCETDLVDLWGAVGPCLGITRVRLQEILLSGAPATLHRLGIAVTAIDHDGDRTLVGFSDGSSGKYDLVVGADGINSTVRDLAVGAVAPEYAGIIAWRSVVPIRPEGMNGLMVLLGEGRFFGLVPVGDGQTYGFGAVESERFHDELDGRLARFRARFAGFGGPVPAYLAALERDEQLHVGPIEWIEPEHWYRGQVVLMGDAAHAATPHMGEGGSMALEDAVALAEELRAAATVESALERYVARRSPRANWVQQQSRIAARGWVLPPAVRDAALRERGDQMLRDRYSALIPPL